MKKYIAVNKNGWIVGEADTVERLIRELKRYERYEEINIFKWYSKQTLIKPNNPVIIPVKHSR